MGRKKDSGLEIVCRIAPSRPSDQACVVAVDDRIVQLIPPVGAIGRNGELQQERAYKFAAVFDGQDSQRVVFQRCALDFIQDLIAGQSSVLFTYGVTGSGKSFTINGKADQDDAGILPRTFDVLFNGLPNAADKCLFKPDGRNGFYIQSPAEAQTDRQRLPEPNYQFQERLVETQQIRPLGDDYCSAVFISYIEIYNDNCYDLFDDSAADGRSRTIKAVRLDPFTQAAYVEKVTEIEVQSTDEVLEQYLRAQERRQVAATLLNANSSRAHSMFNIRLVTAPRQKNTFVPVQDQQAINVAEFTLVDLAGSERAKRTEHTGERLNESSKINQSLSVLRQCFDRLRDNARLRNPQPVPYRDSKLTTLFKRYFEGQGKIRMIVCVNPRPADYEENILVMNFAELAKQTRVKFTEATGLPLGELTSLNFNRRKIDRWHKEFMEAVGTFDPVMISLFDEPPPIEIGENMAEDSIERLEEYYTKRELELQRYRDTVNGNTQAFGEKLKQRLCVADLLEVENQELKAELNDLRNRVAQLDGRYNQTKREINSLRIRLSRYEAEEINDRRRQEDVDRRVRNKDAQIASQRKTLNHVAQLFEAPVFIPPKQP